MTYSDDQINERFAAQDARMEQLEIENQFLRTITSKLLNSITLIPVKGGLPEFSQLSRLECQVFHTHGLTLNQRRGGKTEWSLRLTAHVRGKRITPDINVALYPPDKCLITANKMGEFPEAFATTAQNVLNHGYAETMLLGMLKGITDGEGTPYIPDQFCIFGEFLEGNPPDCCIMVGGHKINLDRFGPARGTSTNSAKWYANWLP